MVNLVLDINGSSQANMETQRMALIDIFKPTNTPIILQNVRDDGTYNLDCYYVGGPMSMPFTDRQGWNQKVLVTLKANDPTFYDPAGNDYTFAISAGADTMVVPTVIPMTVGASTISATGPVRNDGNVSAYPVIRVTGPINDCVITNNSTGEKLDFTGYNLAAGTYLDIDLRYGYKTVTLNNGTNEIDELTTDSDLVSWHLGASPEVKMGVNSITVTGTSCTQATAVSLAWFNRFIGI